MSPDHPQDFGPGHFADWPATVATERVERAIQFVQDEYRKHPDLDTIPKSGNPDFDRDIMLTAESMTNHLVAGQIDLSVLDRHDETDMLIVLYQLLAKEETPNHFACAIIDDLDPGRPDQILSIGITNIFTMAKHHDWMGLCLLLQNVRDHHIQAFQSTSVHADPSAMIAIPDTMMPPHVPTALPAGISLLREITTWHGASSFHWYPDLTAPTG